MDEEPVARALLVAGVTYLTVGLVTLALGIVFVVVDYETPPLLVVWSVAIASGFGAILAGAQISSLTCHGRSSRPATAWCVACLTITIVVAAGAQVALLVLSSFHVMKAAGSRREIFIFFIASSTIQVIALVTAPLLLLTCNSRIAIPRMSRNKRRKENDTQDNYGFIGDGEMWCSSRPPKGTNLSRWPAMEHLANERSSSSSVGSIHTGHYIAGDHHPKFIGPSSEESNSVTSTPSIIDTRLNHSKSKSNGDVVFADVHPSTSKINKNKSNNGKVPERPPRQRDFVHHQSTPKDDRSDHVTVSTISRGYSPLGSPGRKRIYLYDPVELEIVSPPSLQSHNWRPLPTTGGTPTPYEDAWVPRKGIFGHSLHGISVNGLHNLRPSTSASLPSRTRIPGSPSTKRTVRPRDPPPAIPNGNHRGSLPLSNGNLSHGFVIGEWEDLNSPVDGIRPQVTSTPKHSRKVTFVES